MIFQELKNLLYTLVGCLNDLVQLFSMVGSFSMTKMTHLANGWLAQSMVGWFSKIWKTLYKPWLDAQMFYYIFFQWLDHFPCLKWLFSSMVGYFSQWLADFPKIEKPFINHSKMPKCFLTSCVNGWIIFHNLYILSSQWLAGSVNGWMIFHFALFYFSVGWNKMVG